MVARGVLASEQIATFEGDGFVFVPGLFTAGQAAHIGRWVDQVMAWPELPGRLVRQSLGLEQERGLRTDEPSASASILNHLLRPRSPTIAIHAETKGNLNQLVNTIAFRGGLLRVGLFRPELSKAIQMGFRVSYFAAQIDPVDLAQALGMTATDRTPEQPDCDWWSAHLKQSGWSLVLTGDTAFGERVRKEISALSEQTEVLHCEVCETSMWSSATSWSNGVERWRVTHDGGQKGARDLNATGDLPAAFAVIRDRALTQQRAEEEALAERRAEQEGREDDGFMGTDFVFDVSVDLMDELIQYRYDRVLGPDDAKEYILLDPPSKTGVLPLEPPSKPGFLSRLFGRS